MALSNHVASAGDGFHLGHIDNRSHRSGACMTVYHFTSTNLI